MVTVLITAVAVASLVLRDEQQILQDDLRARAIQLGEILSNQIIEPLLYQEDYKLHELFSTYLSARDTLLVYGEVYNDKGEKLFAKGREEIVIQRVDPSLLASDKFVVLRDVDASSNDHPLDILMPIISTKIGTIGYLRLGFSVNYLLKTILASKQNVWAVTILIAVAGTFTGLWMARSLFRPILLLNQAAHEVGRGNLGVLVPERGIGEIRELGLTFNTMSLRIKQLVDEITAAQENLVRTEKLYALGEFATGLAHEIKNPLTSIQMLIQRASEQEEAVQGEDLKVIIDEISRIDATVSQFLHLARQTHIQTGKADFNSLVEDVLAITRLKIEKSGISIDKRLADNLLPIQIDAAGIKQILLNGLLNALQSMQHGGKLTITTNREANTLKCTINDTGCGITEENLKYIFDPFFTTKENGTGMGLSVAWNIAQKHKGNLDIVSEVNTGTTLILTLPYDNPPGS
jgi:signal transduction histidine kinase